MYTQGLNWLCTATYSGSMIALANVCPGPRLPVLRDFAWVHYSCVCATKEVQQVRVSLVSQMQNLKGIHWLRGLHMNHNPCFNRQQTDMGGCCFMYVSNI